MLGEKFGRLTVLAHAGENRYRQKKCLCECECGRKKEVLAHLLRNGHTRSCGCLRSENYRALFTRHGKSGTREYRQWQSMIERCENSNIPAYRDYGGRGIEVCQRWRKSFEAFYADMGSCPDGWTIDRRNVDGHYEPENCRWADRETQTMNRRDTLMVTYRGETRPLTEWASLLGVARQTLYGRLYVYGWPVEEAMTSEKFKRRKPPGPRNNRYATMSSAAHAVSVALRTGRLKRQECCSHPGCHNVKVQAHHHMGYSRGNWLNVIWLCRQHHHQDSMPRIEFRGEVKTTREWAESIDVAPHTLRSRLQNPSWTLEEALTTPSLKGKVRPGKKAGRKHGR